MKEKFISEYISGDEILDFFVVKSINIRIDKNGGSYLDLKIGDKTGEINGRKWNLDSGEESKLKNINSGDFIKISGVVAEYRGMLQIKVEKLREKLSDDVIKLEDYILKAPEDSDDMYDYIVNLVNSFKDDDFKRVCNNILSDNKESLIYYPAAKSFHHAVYGGLLYHMKRMLMSGEALCKIYKFLNRDLLLAGIIIHDIEKLNEMDANKMGIVSDYTFNGKMIGHLVQGAQIIDKVGKELNIPQEKSIMLQHMAISHHYYPEFGSPIRPLFPEAEILHHIDTIDARMFTFEDALNSVKPGEFTDKLWTLDGRSVYRHNDWED